MPEREEICFFKKKKIPLWILVTLKKDVFWDLTRWRKVRFIFILKYIGPPLTKLSLDVIQIYISLKSCNVIQ